ncbi:MAG: hypothetical protein KF850_08460 [Labilithrix sp.]|nr:hypothetical protein [Labilithrix sp.]MBX3212051.1 hypothetical protein [Labilithrix sp.]
MTTGVRSCIVTFFIAVVSALVAGCAVDPTDGIAASRGPVGSLGASCRCSNGQPDCDGDQGQCQEGLSCMRTDSGNQVCTQACPCPLNYICKAAGVPGARLACFKQP